MKNGPLKFEKDRCNILFWSKCAQMAGLFIQYLAACDNVNLANNMKKNYGREPWSSGYGRRLMFLRSWVRILAL